MIKQEQQANLLMDIIKNDREEVRSQEDKIYNIITSVVIASFGITAFIMGNATLSSSPFGLTLLPGIDLGLLLILVQGFWRLRENLYTGQEFLQQRQQLLENVANTTEDPNDTEEVEQFMPFNGLAPLGNEAVVRHEGAERIFWTAAVVLAIKFLVLAGYMLKHW
jgi:hypothetical protein